MKQRAPHAAVPVITSDADAIRLYTEKRYIECAPYIRARLTVAPCLPFAAMYYDICRWDLDGQEHSLWEACTYWVCACALGDQALSDYMTEVLRGESWRGQLAENPTSLITRIHRVLLGEQVQLEKCAASRAL